jgi:UDP-2,3-diacylglucosamine pyrophosphatase LpxH
MRKDIVAIVCPDIHGRTFWKKASEEYDGSVPFIFLGDYFDPYSEEKISIDECRKNFNEIWEFKKKWGDNVILLLGNHDLSYYDKKFKTCRYSYEISEWYKNFLHENLEHFKICHSITNNGIKYLFSHAGINPLWMEINGFEPIMESEYINSLFISNSDSFNDITWYRGGYDRYGSPIWADIREFTDKTIEFKDKNVRQIVGHTQLIRDKFETNGVYCIDSRQTFIITNNNEIETY